MIALQFHALDRVDPSGFFRTGHACANKTPLVLIHHRKCRIGRRPERFSEASAATRIARIRLILEIRKHTYYLKVDDCYHQSSEFTMGGKRKYQTKLTVHVNISYLVLFSSGRT